MSKFILAVNTICVFVISVLPFLCVEELETRSVIVTTLVKILLYNKLLTVVFCSGWIAIFSLLPKWIFPSLEKKRLKKKLLKRITDDLLDKDKQNHRVTLFREVSYIEAWLRNYWALILHCLWWRKKNWKAYCKRPKYGRYLVVDMRYGNFYEKSFTMFRVVTDDEKNCTSVAGYIRFQQAKAFLKDLPDIVDIELASCDSIDKVSPKKLRKGIREYMEKGFIKDFDTLRKLHRKARHFYGTIIEGKDSKIWGVLLIDSTSKEHPFTDNLQMRFNSFAITLQDVINMEV